VNKARKKGSRIETYSRNLQQYRFRVRGLESVVITLGQIEPKGKDRCRMQERGEKESR
jgi:hypothetical protein